MQVVNFGSDAVSLTISITGLQASVNALGSTTTVLTSGSVNALAQSKLVAEM